MVNVEIFTTYFRRGFAGSSSFSEEMQTAWSAGCRMRRRMTEMAGRWKERGINGSKHILPGSTGEYKDMFVKCAQHGASR